MIREVLKYIIRLYSWLKQNYSIQNRVMIELRVVYKSVTKLYLH